MTDEAKKTMGECVESFLSLALTHPEKPPKTQRAERENQMQIIGFNRAQEALRDILRECGKTPRCRELAEVRHEDQIKPMMAGGGLRLWVAS